MKITADLQTGKLYLAEISFDISCKVRTLRNGNRRSNEVVHTVPANLPYDPVPFPKGTWNITGVDWQKSSGFDARTYGPVKIKTDAWQSVKVWELDDSGDYLKETDRSVRDTAYWLHYSESNTTLGCIRLASATIAEKLGAFVEGVLKSGEQIQLEVV